MLPTYILAHHTPPPAPLPTLTVNAKGRVYFSKALLHKMSLRTGQAIDLLPPCSDCLHWQLDLRSTATRRIRWYPPAGPRIDGVRFSAGLVDPSMPLTLTLPPTAPAVTGLYLLLPASTR
ncbi:hypothetical protein FNT36_14380 [Hymenobacter setariae]|uniref:Uncharacterized protein n=1 Tax=Hymenobacter setariae TaxID=2594794 RepID=A0A558BVX4_9BACT|nr:hypothetical protein [Hymenobacter setariae]TVT40652.1 hypothetical protein FNT36_14380 [Hymenobacter setariae]